METVKFNIGGCQECDEPTCLPVLNTGSFRTKRRGTINEKDIEQTVVKILKETFATQSKPSPEAIKQYNQVRISLMLLTLAISIYKCHKYFFTSTLLGVLAEKAARDLKIKGCEKFSEKIDQQKQLEASGCLDIVPKIFGLKMDSRITLVFATIIFLCHIDHNHSLMKRASVVYVGITSGFMIYHMLEDKKIFTTETPV
jgi:hypothetical protein